MNTPEGQSVSTGDTLVMSWPPHEYDGPLLDWLSDEGLLDWVTVETGGHG